MASTWCLVTRRRARKGSVRQRGALFTAALAGALALAMAVPAVASANYYGVAQFQGDFHGTSMGVQSNTLTVPDLSTQFADNDNWVVNNGTAQYWIEAGLIHGTYCCTNYAASPSFFWADSRPNGGFHSHQGETAQLGVRWDDQISYLGNGDWRLIVGGFSGNSTNNITSSQFVETGTEVTTQAATACSQQWNLSWFDSNDVLHNGWSNSQGSATLDTDNPPNAEWVTKPLILDDHINMACNIGDAPASAAVAATPPPSVTTTKDASSLDEPQIAAIAEAAATQAGDPSPTLIESAEGTRAQANQVASGEIVPGDEQSVLIVEVGNFVASNVPLPPQAVAPSGSVLTLVVNASTGQTTDFGIQNNIPSLTSLGNTTVYAGRAIVNARLGDSPRNGTVTGAIKSAGGPPPSGGSRAKLAGIVTVFSRSGKQVIARERVRKGHDFRFTLAPRTYLINAGRRLHSAGGCAPRVVHVRRNHATRVNVYVDCVP